MAKKEQNTALLIFLGLAALGLLFLLSKRKTAAAAGAGGSAGSAGGNIIAGVTGIAAGFKTGATAPAAYSTGAITPGGYATLPAVPNEWAMSPGYTDSTDPALPGLSTQDANAIAMAEGGAVIS